MIIFNNTEMPLHYLKKDNKKQPMDELVIEIHSTQCDPKVLLQMLQNGEDISNLANISAYKTGEGKFFPWDSFLESTEELEEEASPPPENRVHTAILNGGTVMEEESTLNAERSNLAKAYEGFVFHNPWRSMPFEACEITREELIAQLSYAVGIMPTLKDIPNKTVEELLQLSSIGDKLYWHTTDSRLASQTLTNRLPNLEEIESYQKLNDYEKRILSTSSAHPLYLLEIIQKMKERGGRDMVFTSTMDDFITKNFDSKKTNYSPDIYASFFTNPISILCRPKEDSEIPLKAEQPKTEFIVWAEEISRELYNGFVPRVLSEYVYSHMREIDVVLSANDIHEKMREIVSNFNRTSVSKIAKYKSPTLFALSDQINFAEVKQEHIDLIGSCLPLNTISPKLVRWYCANKDTPVSDLAKLFALISQNKIKASTLDPTKTAKELIDDVLNAKGKADCRKMEEKYGYSFADNELAIRGRHTIAQEGKLKMYMLPANDYRNFTVGYDTHCCQRFDNAGESCVWKATQDPFAGTVVIEKNGNILAQAFVWTDEVKDTLVFDNMEFANDRDVAAFTSIIAAWCEAMPYKNIHMGMGYNTLGNGFGRPVSAEDEATLPTTLVRNPRRDNYADDGVDIYTDYHVGRSYGNKARMLKKDGETFIVKNANARTSTRPDEATRWDIMLRPENVFWLNDYRQSIDDRIAFAREFITNQTPEVQMTAVQKNLQTIKFIENPTESVQEYVIQKDPLLATFITNPCERVQEILLDMDFNYIRKIRQPSEAMAIKAVRANGLLLEAIPQEQRTENVIREAVIQNGYAIKFVERPSETVMRLAVTSTPKVITMIPNAPIDIKRMAVSYDPSILRLLNEPDEGLQIAGVRVDPYSINTIKNPTANTVREAIERQGLLIRNFQYQYPEFRMAAIRSNPFALRVLKDPTIEECVTAVTINPNTMSIIKDKASIKPDLYMAVNNALQQNIVRQEEEVYEAVL